MIPKLVANVVEDDILNLAYLELKKEYNKFKDSVRKVKDALTFHNLVFKNLNAEYKHLKTD